MTSAQRVAAALSRREPDRVPVLLLMTFQGAEEMGMALPDYLRDPAAIAEGQARLLARYGHDCVYAFTYAAAEAEALGGEIAFFPDAPPIVARAPLSDDPAGWERLVLLEPESSPPLARTLELIRLLAGRFQRQVPVLANVVGPFSLPAMLLGMERWLHLLVFGDADRRARLLETCCAFCIRWANAQLAAGANAIAYFDPMSSTEISTTRQFLDHAMPALRRVAAAVQGPLVFATAGGRMADRADHIAQAGAAALVVSAADDLGALKQQVGGCLALAGNLNNIAMPAWDPLEVERQVRRCLAAAAPGGGYLVCDQHGEIARDTPQEVLHAIVKAAGRWGKYPLPGVGGEP